MKEFYSWQSEVSQRIAGMRSRMPHALLLKGPQGIGKLDFAMDLAASLLCESPNAEGTACGNCPSCHWFMQEAHPDFRLLQPEALNEAEEAEEEEGKKKKASRQIPIDQVRELYDFTSLSAHRGGYRVALVYPAEAMNSNAANALLKTLEEPPPKMLILLVSHKPQQLLPTILSRCVAISMPQPSLEESVAWLQQQGVNQPQALLAQAGFAPLAAMRLVGEGLEDCNRFLKELRLPEKFDPYTLAEQFQKAEMVHVIQWLQQWCYDLQSAKLTGKVRYNMNLTDSIKALAAKINPIELIRYQKELLAAKRSANHPLNQRLQLESLLLAYRQMMLAKP
jgi:DNA polymerase III subunit delta'